MEKMTIKQLSKTLGVATRTVARHAMSMGLTENGKTTYLTEEQATQIKIAVERSGRNDLDNIVQVKNIQSDIEMIEKAKDVMSWLNLKLTKEKERRELAENRVKRLTHNSNTFTTGQIAKELNMRSAQELNKALQARGIQYKDSRGVWVLYADYADKGLVNIKQKEINGKPRYYREWTGIGRDYLIGLFQEAMEA